MGGADVPGMDVREGRGTKTGSDRTGSGDGVGWGNDGGAALYCSYYL